MPAIAFKRFRAFPFALLLIFAMALPVFAGPFEDAVGKFANDEYSDTEDAVAALATSGNPLAYTIIRALQDGRLMADPDSKKVYVTQPDGKIIDAATGTPLTSIPDSATAVRVNNKLRRGVEAALGALTLQSPDPDKRIQAAQSVFKTPRGEPAAGDRRRIAEGKKQGREAGVQRSPGGDRAVQG